MEKSPEYIVRIISIKQVTHNVRSYQIEKPDGYSFTPGQATEVSINHDGWVNEKRPFTFTCLNDMPYLEFTIKSYHDHKGVTDKLSSLVPGDSLIIRDVWGAIAYKNPGYFIAGGAGITPFIAIFRSLHAKNQLKGNKLFFSNQTAADIIYEEELLQMLGKENIIFTLSRDDNPSYDHRHINEEFLKEEVDDFGKSFYVCGPDPMIAQINQILTGLGASPEAVIFEK